MLAQSFEIKVAILGHVSVGKTTVLNALLQDKFSEVSKRRTTAGINHFWISSRNNEKSKKGTNAIQEARESSHTTSISSVKDSNDHEKTYSFSSDDDEINKDSERTLNEIIKDNSDLREKRIIQEKSFLIEVDEPLVKMRDDTQLILIDIPGVNEAGSSKLYLDYVKDSWDGFDAVIVVMDVVQGVNTEEQVKLLQFVKENQDEKKQVPLIILVNKVDDPDDEEIKELVREVRLEVESIFQVQDREKYLQDILKFDNKTVPQAITSASPAFIPISAENGFLYRAASHMKQSNFKKFDMAYIDKIGHEEFGKFKWKRLTRDQKYDAVYKVVSDPAQYKERLESSHFDKFLLALDYFVGGESVQKDLIGKQLSIALEKLSHESDFADSLSGIYDKFKIVEKSTTPLNTMFWVLYKKCRKEAFAAFSCNPGCVNKLHKPMKELVDYSQGLHKKLYGQKDPEVSDTCFEFQKRLDTNKIIFESMVAIITEQCEIIVRKIPFQNPNSWGKKLHEEKASSVLESLQRSKKVKKNLSSWNDLSPRDWTTVISSILLMTHNKHFCENFGQQIADLQWVSHIAGSFGITHETTVDLLECNDCRQIICRCGNYRHHEYNRMIGGHAKFSDRAKNRMRGGHAKFSDRAEAKTVATYNGDVSIQVPRKISHPMHWGHLAWMFCEFMETKSLNFVPQTMNVGKVKVSKGVRTHTDIV